MTIDVGYAHLALPDGSVVDFVDVPGHDRLVGNMLVGAGEIDAALLVVAADDGPNAQTLEHLELLDALGIRDGIVVVTKADLAPDAERRAALVAEVAALLARTTPRRMRRCSSPWRDHRRGDRGVAGDAIGALAGRLAAGSAAAGLPSLAIDRVFAVKGRGTVVTGSLRGGRVAAGTTLRLIPDGVQVRVREVQVRGATVEAAEGGRTALLVGGVEAGSAAAWPGADDGPGGRRDVPGAGGDPAGRDRRGEWWSAGAGGPRAPAAAPRHGAGRGAGRPRAARVHRPAGRVRARDAAPRSADRGRARGPVRAAAALAGLDRGRRSRPRSTATAWRLAAAAHGGRGRRRSSWRRWARRPRGSTCTARCRVVAAGRSPRTSRRRSRARARQLVADHHAAEPSSTGVSAAILRQELALAARRLVTLGRVAADEVARQVADGLVADGDAGPGRGPAAGRRAGTRPAGGDARGDGPARSGTLRRRAPVPRGRGARGGLPARRPARAGSRRPDRPARGRPCLGGRDVPGPRHARAGDGGGGAPHAGRLPRRHGLQPQVRAWSSSRTSIVAGSCAGPTPATSSARGRCPDAGAGRRREGRRRMTSADIVAIVLAGGASSRFGGDKLAVELDGARCSTTPFAAVAEVADDIVVVLAPGAPVPGGARRARVPDPVRPRSRGARRAAGGSRGWAHPRP